MIKFLYKIDKKLPKIYTNLHDKANTYYNRIVSPIRSNYQACSNLLHVNILCNSNIRLTFTKLEKYGGIYSNIFNSN